MISQSNKKGHSLYGYSFHKPLVTIVIVVGIVIVIFTVVGIGIVSVRVNVIRAVYTRENKPRLTLAAAYVSREHPV